MWEEDCADDVLVVVDGVCAEEEFDSEGFAFGGCDFWADAVEFVGEGLPVREGAVQIDLLDLFVLGWDLDDITSGVRHTVTANQHRAEEVLESE